jgi:hypothetical protein
MAQQGPDGVGAADLLGQPLHRLVPGTRTPAAVAGSRRCHATRVSSEWRATVRDGPVWRGRLPFRPAPVVCEGLVDERGGVPEFPEHRPQRMQHPGW